jgi:hypothetical protein
MPATRPPRRGRRSNESATNRIASPGQSFNPHLLAAPGLAFETWGSTCLRGYGTGAISHDDPFRSSAALNFSHQTKHEYPGSR